MFCPMLSLSHLSCGFGHDVVLDDISADFESGSMCAILGANGCGKTTLLRTIARLHPPLQGTVSIGGCDVASLTPRAMAQRVAYVSQHPWTNLDFSAFDIVLMGRNPYQRHLQNDTRHDLEMVEHCMRLTRTWHLRSKRPDQMSGGELQRVMIARALAQDTPILLLDEPTSNLDIEHQFDIMQLLSDINNQQSKSILIVLHDLNLAFRYCPSLLLLRNHRIFFHGAMSLGLTPHAISEVFHVPASISDGVIRFLR